MIRAMTRINVNVTFYSSNKRNPILQRDFFC